MVVAWLIWTLHSPLDDGGLSSRAAIGWTDRVAALRSTELETRVPQPRIRQHASRRCVLGGANRVEILGRIDSRGSREGEVQRSCGNRLPDPDGDCAS